MLRATTRSVTPALRRPARAPLPPPPRQSDPPGLGCHQGAATGRPISEGETAPVSTSDWLKLVSIPFFTGAVGWLINWTGLIMLFNPVRFHGFRIPGLSELSTLLPRKLQEVPGIMQGGIGWQGIVPARAAKMGSISVDKAISKLGTPAEFFEQLEPEKMAEHIVSLFEPEIPAIV